MKKMTGKFAVLGVLAALFLIVAPWSDAGPGRTCLAQPDTYCGFNCSGLSYPACFDEDQERCCWEGPNSCGESTSCSGFCGCEEDSGF